MSVASHARTGKAIDAVELQGRKFGRRIQRTLVIRLLDTITAFFLGKHEREDYVLALAVAVTGLCACVGV